MSSTDDSAISARAPFASPLAEELAEDVLARLLRYVRIDTQSAHGAATSPSTEKQLDLSRLLHDELEEIGLDDVRLDEHGYVYGSLDGTVSAPAIGLIAHVDTSPDVTGTNVDPLVHRRYDGGRIELPGDASVVLDPEELPLLKGKVGHDLVTTDGTTLLGADDKAGVAEIMAAVGYLKRNPEPPHAPIRVCFTVDEEVA
ncbi:MAG: peptidase T, partial [Actinobacteria bacterium]|nr:peptidase T [Actinomycetota bacterium]